MHHGEEPTVVLCYGDSNTWGHDPSSGERFGIATRWPGILSAGLGPTYRVIEEGLSGRTTVWEDPEEPGRNGFEYLVPCLRSHRPIDVVVLMLGTNDLKRRFGLSPSAITDGVRTLGAAVLESETAPDGGAPALILVAAPLVAERAEGDDFAGAATESLELLPVAS